MTPTTNQDAHFLGGLLPSSPTFPLNGLGPLGQLCTVDYLIINDKWTLFQPVSAFDRQTLPLLSQASTTCSKRSHMRTREKGLIHSNRTPCVTLNRTYTLGASVECNAIPMSAPGKRTAELPRCASLAARW